MKTCQPLIIFLWLFSAKCFCGTCPREPIISPCTCESDTIVCSGLHAIDLRQVFSNISKSVADKNFGEFVLTNTAVTELEDGVFSDITFKKFSITNAVNLNRISAMALNSSAFTAEEFRQMGENNLNDLYIEQLFAALSSLARINRIYLDLIDATIIPDHAFKIINGRQTNLESIHLNYIGAHYGHLKAVGNYPFYYLDNLKFISLANQPIARLSANSFDFEVQSKNNLEIRLEATQLNGTSFESGIFLNAKRPLTVSLSHNKITYLDESVFKPVFSLNETVMVTLLIEDNPLVCDCRNKWLTEDKTRIKYRLLEPQCVDGRSVWNLSANDFAIHSFKQQQLSAWQPVITAGTVLPSLFLLGIAATITGVGLLYTAYEVRRFELDYTNCAPLYDTHTCAQLIETNINTDCKCWFQFELADEFESSVYLYYSLSNYFQNHRRYEKSVDTVQLQGKLQASSDCQPFQYKGVNGKQVPIVPCGVIANSLFNDTFRLWYHDIASDIAFRVPLLFTGISWPSDHYKFRNPSGASLQRIYANFTNPPYWGNRNIWQLDAVDPDNNGLQNEGLIVWLRTAAFPQFQKLYARVDHQIGSLFAKSLPKGNYFIEIDYNYPVSEFGGGKQFVLSTTSWFGGNNPFLGIAYIVFGGLTILLTLVLLLIHMRYGMNSFKRIMITETTPYFSKREKRRSATKYQVN